MSRYTDRARAGESRATLYDEITGKIIAELEAGRVPWVQPWGTAAVKAPLAMPKNASTSRQYSGVNVLILWGAVIEHGFTGQSWLTFRQALSDPNALIFGTSRGAMNVTLHSTTTTLKCSR